MSELDLQHPGLTYSVCGPFNKDCERIQKFRQTGDLKHLYRNELDKTCFLHNAAYCDSKYLAKRTISNKLLNDRDYEIVEIVNMMEIKEH